MSFVLMSTVSLPILNFWAQVGDRDSIFCSCEIAFLFCFGVQCSKYPRRKSRDTCIMTNWPLLPFKFVTIKSVAYQGFIVGLGHVEASSRDRRGHCKPYSSSACRSSLEFTALNKSTYGLHFHTAIADRSIHTAHCYKFPEGKCMWSFDVKALAPIESSKMYRLEVLQVDRKAGGRQKTRPDR